jgi:hypothetical protein
MSNRLQRYHGRLERLKKIRSEHDSMARELRDLFWPRQGRFEGEKKNRGGNQHKRIINNASIMARRTLAAGMQTGVTNESRPWFLLQPADEEMMDYGPIAQWFEMVEQTMYRILSRSNMYNVFYNMYSNLGVFGTASADVLYDYEDVVRGYPHAWGSFWLQSNERDVVDTRFRMIKMTVEAMVNKFGLKQCSRDVQRLYSQGNYDELIDVVNVVEPRRDRNPNSPLATDMAWASVWFEHGQDREDAILMESGFEDFPGVAPRWEVNDGAVYGNAPGMDALGDNLQLQTQERRKGLAIDKGLSPPLVGTGGLAVGRSVNLLPGKINWVKSNTTGVPVAPIHTIDPTFVRFLSEDSKEVVQRINDAFYVDLFLMLSQSDRREITAREIEERHEEKLLMLGPVLHRLRDELYDPVVKRVFDIAMREEGLPPPPPELDGEEIVVQYISILHQAQQAVGLVGIDRLTGYVGNLAAVNPEVLDNMDFDEATREYHRMAGVPQAILRDSTEVQELRAQRAKQEQQMQQAAMAEQAAGAANQGAQAAKVLSETRTEDPSALRTLLDTMGGGGGVQR